MLSFDQDPAVRYLDMQYMLGDALLVAPIFEGDGKVDYYLPEGKWTHLLSGEVKEGGRWFSDKYDYFSLPLYVRENTLLPLGINEERPDYDYVQGLSLHLYQLSDGQKAPVRVPNLEGEERFSASARRTGCRIELAVSEVTPGLRFVLHDVEVKNVQGGTFERVGNGVIVIPTQRALVVELASL